jgi:hypothetical protein
LRAEILSPLSPEIQFAIIQPLEAQLAEQNDPSIVYVLLLVRLQFLRERDSFLSSSSLNETRANLCELLAIKLLRHQATTAKGPNAGLLAMSRALVGGLHAFQGANKEVLGRVKQREGYASRTVEQGAGKTNALELAILGKARMFIKSQVSRVHRTCLEGSLTYVYRRRNESSTQSGKAKSCTHQAVSSMFYLVSSVLTTSEHLADARYPRSLEDSTN